MKKISLTLIFTLVTFLGFGQEKSIQKKYGGVVYTISTEKEFGGNGQIQKIELKSDEDLYQLIVDMINKKKVNAKTQKLPNTLVIKKLKIDFVTWEGFSACEIVIRQYVLVSSIKSEGFSKNEEELFMFHKDEFDKISDNFEQGKHSKMFKQFLYNIDFETYPSVIISY